MANTKITTAVIKDDAITTAKIADDAVTGALIADDVALAGNPTTTTQSAGNSTTRIATTAFVTTAINNLVDSAPSALDTLNELAAAMGDDANFSTTITNSIATKAPLASPSLTGTVTITGNFPQLFFVDTAGSDLDAYIVNNANGLFIGKTNTPSSSNDILSLDLTNQRVGIGASSPDSLLELETAVTNASGGLLLTNTNASGYSTVQFKNTGGTAQTYTLALGGSSSAFAQKLYIYDDTDGAARVVLDHSGNLGIGTSGPLAKLHVSGDETFLQGGNTTTGPGLFLGDSNFANTSYFNSAPGIGAVGPYGGVAGGLAFYNYGGAANSRNEAMRIAGPGSTAGFVGINTPSPSALLHIKDGDGTEPTFASDDLLIVQNNNDASDDARITIISGNQGEGKIGFGDDGGRDRGRITYDHSDNSMAFGTNGSAANVKVLSGGNVEIADGDIVIGTNGHGIDFSAATLGSSVSNMSSILDDYEEGSFTPAFSHGGGNYSNRIGSYVKVGGTVNFNIYIQMSSWSSSSDNLQITGLPFASGVAISGLGNSYGGAWVSYVVNAEGSTPIAYGHIGQQQTGMQLYSHSGGTQTAVTASGHGNSFGIIVNGIYHVK